MKDVIIRHHMLNAQVMGYGGSQYVMLETAIAFAEKGIDTYIDSPFIKSRCDLLKLAEFFGVNREEVVNVGIGDSGNNYLIINTSGDVLSGAGDVMYLHYPFFLDYRTYYSPLHGVFDLFGKTYSFTNTVLFPLLSRRVKLYLANSWFTASFFKKYLRIDPIIINPPVNLDDIIDTKPLPMHERENFVLTVSRISPEKRPELTVYIAKRLRKHRVRVVLAGVLSSYNKPYYDSLVELAIREKVDDYIDIYVNIPRCKLVELYKRSLVYVHVTPKEHFGISIVEAMAAGTPSIIPINSGAWIDIAKQDPRIAPPYIDIGEAVCKISKILSNPSEWELLSTNGYKRALELDRKRFRRKIYQAVKPLLIK